MVWVFQLLLSFVNPYKPIGSSTISSSLENFLRKPEIYTGTIKTHSARSTSTSKEDVSGAPIEEILKRRCSSNKSTWQKFDNKSIIQEGQLFQEMAFKWLLLHDGKFNMGNIFGDFHFFELISLAFRRIK